MNPRAFHVQRPLVCVAACFGVGIFVGARWSGGGLWLLPLGIAFSLGLAFFLRRQGRSSLLGLSFLTLFLAAAYAYPFAHPRLPPEGKVRVSARVQGASERRAEDGRVKTLLRQVVVTDEAGDVHRLPGAYWTHYPGPEEPLPLDGQAALFEASLYHPSGQANPWGFDFRAFLLQRQITVGLSGSKGLILSPEGSAGPGSLWARIRQGAGALFDATLGDQGALARALVIGDRTELSEETVTAFQVAGVAHVLSVSGLHVGLMMLSVVFVLDRLRLSRWVRLAVVTVVLLFYCRLLDFSAPVLRASVLTVLMLLGRSVRRRGDPLTALSVAFMLVLGLRPLDLFSVGFQLSFLAVLGILTLGVRINALLSPLSRAGGWRALAARLLKAYGITLSATAFTALPSVAAFHRLSLAGLLVGPAACALVGVLMTGYLALLPVALLYLPLARVLAVPLVFLSRAFTEGMDWFASLPWAAVTLPTPSGWAVAAAYLCLILMTRFTLLKLSRRFVTGVLATLLAFAVGRLGDTDALRYIQLSAGQADAAVIEDGRATYVIDAGEHGGDLAAYLLSEGRTVDTLFLTHLHGDHAGGLRQLLDSRVPIGEIALPSGAREAQCSEGALALVDEAQAAGIPLRVLSVGDALQGDRLSMRVLWPFKGRLYPGMDPNHGSLTMLWDFDGVLMLTTGDLSGDYELYSACPAHILKVAHHGSKHGTRDAYLDIVSPVAALLTLSDRSLERATEVTRRLACGGCQVFDTGRSGALTLTFAQGAVEVSQFLHGKGQP